MDKNEEIVRNAILNDILKMDRTFYGKINLLNSNSISELKNVRDALKAPVINDAPKKLKLMRYGINPDYCETCRLYFNADVVEDEEEVTGAIYFNQIKKPTDIVVKRAIKALLQTGVTSNQEVADSVNILFMGVAQELLQSQYFTTKDFVKSLKPGDNKVSKKLVKTLKELVKEN